MIRNPVATPILARRFDAIVREMSNALLSFHDVGRAWPAHGRRGGDRGPAAGAHSVRTVRRRDSTDPITIMTKAASISAAAPHT